MRKAIFVLFLLPLQLFSQDLSGIWVGRIATSQTAMPFELAINQDLTGYSMMTFMFKGTEKVAVKRITLIRKDSTFNISDDKLIYNNFEMKSRNIKTYCELSITMVDSTMILSGPFHTRSRDLRAGDEDLASGTITLQKQKIQAQTRLIGKLDSLKLSNTLTFSNPAASTQENPAVAVSEKAVPAAVEKPAVAKPLADKAVAEKLVAENPVAQKPATEMLVAEKPVAEKPVAMSPVAASPAVAVTKKPAPAAVAMAPAEKPVTEKPAVEKPVAAMPVAVSSAVASPAKDVAVVRSASNNATTPAAAPPQPKIIAPAAEITSRKTVVIRTIDFKSDSLTLVLYDNGIVDGDTVSVVLNGEVIIPKLGLTEKAYRKVVQIPPGTGDSLQLVMYAENLGSIPPNSGLLIIEDGSDRHEVGFEGDLKRSSAVTLRRKRL